MAGFNIIKHIKINQPIFPQRLSGMGHSVKNCCTLYPFTRLHKRIKVLTEKHYALCLETLKIHDFCLYVETTMTVIQQNIRELP